MSKVKETCWVFVAYNDNGMKVTRNHRTRKRARIDRKTGYASVSRIKKVVFD